MKKEKLSVLIININNLDYTRNCINDLLFQTVKDFNITLIDQGSTEIGTDDYLNGLSIFKNINIIRNSENISIHKLWNDFYKNTQSDYLCYLNNDVRLTDNFIEDTINILNKENSVGIVVHSTNCFKYNKKLDVLDYKFSKREIKQGWDFTIRKNLYTLIPSILQFYYGDDWLFHHVYIQNYKVAICISSPIIHYGSKSEKYSSLKWYEETDNFNSICPTKYPHYSEYSDQWPIFRNFNENPIETHIYYNTMNNIEDVYFENERFIRLNEKIFTECNFSLLKPITNIDIVNISQYLIDEIKMTINFVVYTAIEKGYKKWGISDPLMKFILPLYLDYLPNYNLNKRLTVMIPYRNREENLEVFIPYFKNFMKNYFSEIPYKIVVVEQGNDKTFNKGLLYNVGFLITSGNTDYYCLHDVDQLPISADYSYNIEPCHLCVNALEQGVDGVFKNPYAKEKYQHKGGVLTIPTELYKLSNGLSNNYWGWGFEDDDFSFRLFDAGHHLQRYGTRMNHGGLENNDKGYYITIYAKSVRFEENEYFRRNYHYASDVVNKKIDWRLEGLNTTKFNIIDTVVTDDYTKYIIDFENDVDK